MLARIRSCRVTPCRRALGKGIFVSAPRVASLALRLTAFPSISNHSAHQHAHFCGRLVSKLNRRREKNCAPRPPPQNILRPGHGAAEVGASFGADHRVKKHKCAECGDCKRSMQWRSRLKSDIDRPHKRVAIRLAYVCRQPIRDMILARSVDPDARPASLNRSARWA